jgi:hypothetical protein
VWALLEPWTDFATLETLEQGVLAHLSIWACGAAGAGAWQRITFLIANSEIIDNFRAKQV